MLTGGDDGPCVVRGIPVLAPPHSPPHCLASPWHAIASTRSHDAPCTLYPCAGRSDCDIFVPRATLTSADDGPCNSTYGKGSNAPLITFLASRFGLVDSCAHPLTGPPDRI